MGSNGVVSMLAGVQACQRRWWKPTSACRRPPWRPSPSAAPRRSRRCWPSCMPPCTPAQPSPPPEGPRSSSGPRSQQRELQHPLHSTVVPVSLSSPCSQPSSQAHPSAACMGSFMRVYAPPGLDLESRQPEAAGWCSLCKQLLVSSASASREHTHFQPALVSTPVSPVASAFVRLNSLAPLCHRGSLQVVSVSRPAPSARSASRAWADRAGLGGFC